MDSDNPTGADNQQETVQLDGILRDCTPGLRGAICLLAVKVQSDPRGDTGSQTEMIWPLEWSYEI